MLQTYTNRLKELENAREDMVRGVDSTILECRGLIRDERGVLIKLAVAKFNAGHPSGFEALDDYTLILGDKVVVTSDDIVQRYSMEELYQEKY